MPKSHKLIDMVLATLRHVASALAITRQRNLPERIILRTGDLQGGIRYCCFDIRGFASEGVCCLLTALVLLTNYGMPLSCAGMPVVLSQEVESVLVGAAILGACASGDFTSVQVC